MTRDETIALWRECEAACKAALAEGKSKEEAHEAAKAIWNAWAGRDARSAMHLGGIRPVYRREEREVRGFCSRRNRELRSSDTGVDAGGDGQFQRPCL